MPIIEQAATYAECDDCGQESEVRWDCTQQEWVVRPNEGWYVTAPDSEYRNGFAACPECAPKHRPQPKPVNNAPFKQWETPE